MTREQLIFRWINKVEPKHPDVLREMLSTLDENELSRYFYMAENKEGKSIRRLAVLYRMSVDSVRHQLQKAKMLGEKSLKMHNVQ